jgi:hypothetical protein
MLDVWSWESHGGWIFLLSIVMFFGSLIAMPFAIARMPSDYFVSREVRRHWRGTHPVLRYGWLALKNVVGAILVLAGIAMLVLPGQGVVTILIGLTLLDFPGKRGLELKIVRRRRVQRAMNWIRKKAGRPPLVLPDA